MATIRRFEDLDVWQLARQLNIKIIPLLEKLSESKNYDLKSVIESGNRLRIQCYINTLFF